MNKIFIIIWELQAGEGTWEKAAACVCPCVSQFRYLLKCAKRLQAGYRQKFNRLLGLALVYSPCLVRHLKWILLPRKVSVDWGRVVFCAAWNRVVELPSSSSTYPIRILYLCILVSFPYWILELLMFPTATVLPLSAILCLSCVAFPHRLSSSLFSQLISFLRSHNHSWAACHRWQRVAESAAFPRVLICVR